METPLEHLRNALQIARLTDPIKDGPMDVRESLTAIEARLMKAIVALESKAQNPKGEIQ